MCEQQSEPLPKPAQTANESSLHSIPDRPYPTDTSLSATPDWAPLRNLVIGFPVRVDIWRDNAIPAQKALLSFISQLLHHTSTAITIVAPPNLSIPSQKLLNDFNNTCLTSNRLDIVTMPMDDCWLRDTGPIFANSTNFRDDARLMGTCFKFNAWGGIDSGCYTDYRHDALVNKRICQAFRIPVIPVNLILEGGSITSDGHGTIITTEQCLLNRNRNPNLTKQDIEAALHQSLGARKVIWLPYGAAYDDDTDGHVDNIAVFARSGHILLTQGGCAEQRRRSRAAAAILQGTRDAEGRQIVVHTVPTPILYRTREEANGVQHMEGVRERTPGRICASFVNFLICDDCIFAPRFGVFEDEIAEAVLKNVFERRRLVMVDAREFVLAGGGLHCLTLGIPR